MTSTRTTKRQYRLGDLVIAAYDEAARSTRSHRAASRLVVRRLTSWIARSNRRDLLRQIPQR